MFAEATSDMSNWASIVGNIVNIGFAAVVGWYLLTKALPKMQDDFRAELTLGRTTSAGDLKEARLEHREALKMVVDHCERESAKQTDIIRVDLSLVVKALSDQREVMEDVRDALSKVKDEIAATRRG